MSWIWCLAPLLWAAEPPPEQPEEPPPDEESDEGFDAALREALEADAAAADESQDGSDDEGDDAPSRTSRPGVQSLNPDISFIADVAFAYFSDEPSQTGAHDPQVNGFNLQQLELAVSQSVDPYFRFDSNIVFSRFGVEIEEVYATTLALPGTTQLRVGQFLTRFGRQNPTHPHAWHFADQPLPLGRLFGGEGNRGLGVEGSVLLPLPWYVEIVASETMADGAATNRSFFGSENLGVRGPLDFQTTLVAKQFFPLGDDLSLMWGLSYAGGPNPTGRSNRSEILGTDVYLKYRPVTVQSFTVLSLHSEWFYRRRQVPGDVLSDVNGFTQIFWRFARRWGAAARHETGTPAWNLDGEVGVDPLDPRWTDDRHRFSGALTYWPTEFSRVRLQGASDLRPWTEGPAWAAFVAFEFNVGAHGSHSF